MAYNQQTMTTPTPSGYKSTKLWLIPNDWEILKLGEIIIERDERSMTNNEFQLLTSSRKWIFLQNEYFNKSVASKNNIGYKIIKKDDFVYRSMSDDWIFVFNRLVDYKIWLVSPAYWVFYVKNFFCIEFFNYVINRPLILNQIKNFSQWSTRLALKFKKLLEATIICPTSHVEQQKIADILSSVDALIDDTDAIISHQKKLKKWLLNKLMTEWIWHTDFVNHPKLGKLPKQWKVVKIIDIINQMKSWLSRQLNTYNIWIWVIRSNNLVDNKMDFSDIKYRYLDDKQWVNIDNYKLENWDVLINFINSIAQIWKTAIFKSDWDNYIYTTNLLRLKVNWKILNNYFLYFTQTTKYYKEIQNITKPAVNQASFTTKDFWNIEFCLPPLPEQQKIAEILGAVDADIEREQNYKNSLLRLKHGLMQKLLTGEIRVKF